MPLFIKLAPWALGGLAAWWANDALERKGVKAPGQMAPGDLVTVGLTGAAVGAISVLFLTRRRKT